MKTKNDPNSLLRIEEVEELVGLDRSTIYKKIAKKLFPEQFRPTESGYAARWRLGDILQWIASRPKRRLRDPIKVRESRAKKAAEAEKPARIILRGLDMTYALRWLTTPGSPMDVLLNIHRRYDDEDWEATLSKKQSGQTPKSSGG